ncbi:uncharacterized protein PAE49_020971 isoform 2-T3 [Odontesthes bonariensis]|uniref:uncharacterized protein LOC142369018 isoform X2 n=1 Tax=Odontesthes bonariensis TaxID=219752 RepID=UPI003F586149
MRRLFTSVSSHREKMICRILLLIILTSCVCGAEVSESQDEEFAGRVQSDKDALREGRLRLNVSRLRTEDSGLYLCAVKNDYGSGSGRCRLSVNAAADLSQPQRPTESPQPDRPGWIILYAVMGLIGGVAVVQLIKLVLRHCFPKSTSLDSSSLILKIESEKKKKRLHYQWLLQLNNF